MTTTPTHTPHLAKLVERRLGTKSIEASSIVNDLEILTLTRANLTSVAQFLRDDRDAWQNMLVDVTVVDRRGIDDVDRFLLVVSTRSTRLPYRARLLASIPERDLSFPTLTNIYPSADWLEREVHDLFGILPDGHPFVRRLILYPGFAGHPLRRDYPASKTQPLVPLRSQSRPSVIVSDGDDVGEPRVGSKNDEITP